MKKRGQFFIIFAVILGILILSLATVFNTTIRTGREGITERKFKTLCQNYEEEIYRVGQHMINISDKNNENISIYEFTTDFMSYAKKTDSNFQLIYVYGNNQTVFVYNSTNNQIEKHPDKNSLEVRISENIIKEYELTQDEKFWFIALTKKDGEEYVCE